MEQVFHALALIGAVVMTVLVYRLIAKNAPQSPADASEDAFINSIREAIKGSGKREEEAISEAVSGEDPAGDLARLGNERRE